MALAASTIDDLKSVYATVKRRLNANVEAEMHNPDLAGLRQLQDALTEDRALLREIEALFEQHGLSHKLREAD